VCRYANVKPITYYCSLICVTKDQEQHKQDISNMGDLVSTSGCGSSDPPQILHSSWAPDGGADADPRDSSDEIDDVPEKDNITIDENSSSTSPKKYIPTKKTAVHPPAEIDLTEISPSNKTKTVKKKAPQEQTNPPKQKKVAMSAGNTKKKERKRIREPTVEELAAKAQIRKNKALSLMFNKLRGKICLLEPLAPTWSWVCNVDKNSTNSRSTKHKYTSPPKLRDMTQIVATNKISRIWLDCVQLAKDIENLDPSFCVTLRADKPETDRNARMGKHQYSTQPEGEISETEESSQDLSQGSVSSQESQHRNMDTDATTDCRVCKEPIFLDCVQDFIACTQPSGSVHFSAHFVCLGFYTQSAVERKALRASYRCPRHSHK